MATQVQWRGGSTAEHATFTGAAREVTVDTQKQTLVVHDGSTVGGAPLQKQYPPLGSAAAPTFTFSGDTNTGIYSPGADQVAVSTGGTGRLFVDASGNIKVSTGEISQTSAGGYIRLDGGTGSGNGANVLVFGESHGAAPGRVALSAVGVGAITASTGGAERLRITSAGLVGIGSSTPQLSIGAVGGSVLHIAGAGTTGLRVQNTGGNSVDIYAGTDGFINQSGSGALNFQLAGSTKATLTSTGLGIGTTSPVYKLDVTGGGIGVNTSAGTAGSILFNQSGIGVAEVGMPASENALTFKTWTGAALVERARIDSSGRLGIGTSSPSSALDVSGAISLGAVAIPSAGTARIFSRNTDSNLYIQTGSGNNLYLLDGSQDTMAGFGPSSVFLNTGNTTRLAIDSSGNVGIGSTVPNEKLTVADSGSANVYIALQNSTTGTTSADGWYLGAAGTEFQIYGKENGPITFSPNSSEKARIDSSGRLLVGTSSTANRGAAKHIVQGDASFGDGIGKAHTIYKETANLANAATFDVDLLSNTGTCCGFGTVFYSVGTNQQVQTFSFAGRQSGAVVQLQDAIARDSGVSGVTVTFASVTSAGKIRITNGSGSILGQVQVTLFLHSTLS
jgi:hypothetical protein